LTCPEKFLPTTLVATPLSPYQLHLATAAKAGPGPRTLVVSNGSFSVVSLRSLDVGSLLV